MLYLKSIGFLIKIIKKKNNKNNNNPNGKKKSLKD
jgi:hypothetical protein